MSSPGIPQGFDLTKIPNMSPEMMNLLNGLISSLGGGPQAGLQHLQKLASGNEDVFKQIEAPAYQALQQQQAQTANRFSGVGGQDSSAFANALAGQTGQLAQNLASQRNQLMTGAIDKLMSYSQNVLSQKPYEYGLQEQPSTDWESIIKTFGPLILDLIASSQGAPPGVATAATQIGSGYRPAIGG
jgi:hypothetical protein